MALFLLFVVTSLLATVTGQVDGELLLTNYHPVGGKLKYGDGLEFMSVSMRLCRVAAKKK